MAVNNLNNLTNSEEEIKRMLERNYELSEKMDKNLKYIKHYVIGAQIIGVIKILLILTPIVFAVIYLPPLIRELRPTFESSLNFYQEMLGTTQKLDDIRQDAGIDSIDRSKIPPELQKYLK